MDLYHALNRGVDKRTIFLDTQDCARFVHDMFEFNSNKPASNTCRSDVFDLRSRTSKDSADNIGGDKLVDIHGWCLMRNHYHLLLSECTDGGLIKFLRKLNVGYAKYFNERYKRSGTLFQGRTKKILVDSDAYFLHILNYIHLNPLDFLINAQYWRERKIANTKEALAYLEGYKWSSYRDYAGLRNFPSILDTSLFMEVFNNDYTGQLERYIGDISLIEFQHLVLETSDT